MSRISPDLRGPPPEPAPFRGSAPFLRIAPPVSLPLRHFALAAASLLVFAAGVLLGAERLVGFGLDARFAVGLVHVLTLGWIAQSILGAWSQMIPVHGETPLLSTGWLEAGWWLFVGGWAGFVGALWSGTDRYWAGACAAYAGLLVELAVLAATHARAARRDRTWGHFAAAFLWLTLLGLVGVLLAFDRQRGVLFRDPDGALIAHVHMALLGFVVLTVFGAGYRLFPWVALHQLRSRREGALAFALLNAALAALVLDSLLLGRRLLPLWAGLLAASGALYAWQLRAAFSPRGVWDPSRAFVVLGAAGGAAWAALGLGLAWGSFPEVTAARAAYLYAALVGFVTPVILSQVHKIAAFLVWLKVYSPRDWRPPVKVPTIDDLSSRGLAWGEFACLFAAVPLGTFGFLRESPGLVRASGAFLLACAALYALNTGRVLLHLARPDPRWDRPAGG